MNFPPPEPLPASAPLAAARILLLAGLLGLALARADDVPAAAGELEPVLLPPWRIEEKADRQLATARDDTFASTLGSTSVVIDGSWSGRGVATLGEALRRVPGMVLQESFGGFEPPRLTLRGSGLDSAPTGRGVALLVDGLPLARADGSFHSGTFDPLLFSRVEVYRGTVHAGLTPAVLGGVINAVGVPRDAPAGTSLRLEAGDYEALHARFSSISRTADTTVHAAGSHDSQEGCRDHSAQQRTAFAAGLHRRLAPSVYADVSVYAARPKYEVPGPLTLTDALARPRSVSAAVVRDQPQRESSLLRTAVQLKAARTGDTLAAGLAYQRLHDDFRQLQANGESDSMSDDIAAQGTYAHRVALGSVEHNLLLRATGSTGVNRLQRFVNNGGQRDARFADLDLNASTWALNVEDIVWLRPAFAVGAGATALWARREIDDRLVPAGSAGSVSRTLSTRDLSPRAGLLWQPAPHLSVYAAVSRGVEPATFDDMQAVGGTFPNLKLTTRALRAQTATTAEFGMRGAAGRLGWNVAVYRGRWHDEILKLADATGAARGAVNAGPTIHEGVEAALRWRLISGPHRLTLSATATWGRFTFDGDPVYGRNRLAGTPPHAGNAELLYEHPRGWFFGVEPAWTAGRTTVDHAGRLAYGGCGLVNARAGWRFGERLTVFVAGRNLFDRAHIASTSGVLDLARIPATTTLFLPGNARNFSFGLEGRL